MYQGTNLIEMLTYLDEGGKINPRDLARAIKKVDPDFRINGAVKSEKSVEDLWESEMLERQKNLAKAQEMIEDAIRKTPNPSQAMLKYMGITKEQYHERRNNLLGGQK